MLLTSSGLAAMTATSMRGFNLSCPVAGGRDKTSAHKMIRKEVIPMRVLRMVVSDTVPHQSPTRSASQPEIASDNPCSRHQLSECECRVPFKCWFPTCRIVQSAQLRGDAER